MPARDTGNRAIPKSFVSSAVCRGGRGEKPWPRALEEHEVERGIGVPDRKARNWLSLGAKSLEGLGTLAASATRAR